VFVGVTGVFVGVTGVPVAVGVTGVFVGVGVGFRIALNWTLRSWFIAPPPSRLCVRMWNGEPVMLAAPLPVPQYKPEDTWPAQASSTVESQGGVPQELAVNVTVMSTSLLPVARPVCVTAEMEEMLPL